MQKILKRISSFLLAAVLCLGITAVVNTASKTIVADAVTVDEYYSSITADSGTQLSGQLHDLIVSTHKRYTSYADCKTYAVQTDPGKGSNTVMELYTQTDIANSNFDKSGGWNREHVWAQSDSGGLWGTSGAGSDLHHIRPAEKDINNSRGNKKYGEVTGGKSEYTGTTNIHGGYSDSNTFMPLPKVKGDIARIVMYVYLHYNYASNVGGTKEAGATYGKLNFTQIITASNEAAAIALLLKWNKDDPVNEIEITRNEAVYELQGNRNPFIDHPEYADAIWGDGTVTPTPGGDTLTGLTVSPSTLSLTEGASRTLSVTATPSTASKSVTWASSNTDVATVSSNGTVTALKAGTATITATSTVNQNINATCQITVTASTVTPPVDNPPVTPDTPNTPDTPTTPDTPNTPDTPDTPDNSKIAAFHSAVAAIPANGTLIARFNALNKAINAYQALSDSEKMAAESTDIAILQAAINKYNEDLKSYNDAAENANESGLHAFKR